MVRTPRKRKPAPRNRAAAPLATAAAGPSAPSLSLGASLSIREVGDCAARLKVLLQGGATEVDARALETIDTAGLQLLLATAAAARRRGLTLKLLGAQRLHQGAANALGLAEQLAASAQILP
ncbi:MAG TPA: STAS domain-containing protein [Steroidobacteraceae bacterium]|jgi:anti-anti-sigma regulatory factor